MAVQALEPGEGGVYERTPPQDLAAEQSVLGGVLLSKDAIADVVEVLTPHDFYRPAHALVFEAALDLYSRGEPVDPVSVAAELTRSGSLAKVGGASYLHTLVASVPTAANAGYYARLVAEKAILRRLVEAGTRVVQMGYAGGVDGDVDSAVDRAQAEIYAVSERRSGEDYVALSELLNPTLEEIEAIAGRDGGMSGVPTGIADLDRLTNGLHPGQLVIVAARPGLGKALALDTPLPTPTGWTTMGDVAVGDQLIAADGRPTVVVAATGVLSGRPCYDVVFDDGTVIVADAEHQWLTETSSGQSCVRTTEQLAVTLRFTADRVNAAAALALPDVDLPVAPYALGAWLGDGLDSDTEISMRAEGEGFGRRAEQQLHLLGIASAPHIPLAYLRASERQRRALLAGLLDAKGRVLPSGAVQVILSPRLTRGVVELFAGLGYAAHVDRGRVTVHTSDELFWLERKQVAHKERSRELPARGARRITAVRPVASVPVRCVQVDDPDHMYLAGPSMIPTHNSTLALDFARAASIKHGLASVVFSLEMSKSEITMRLLSAEARVHLQHMRTGHMTDDDWGRLARRMGEVSNAPLFIDDSPHLTMTEIRAKTRRLKQRHDLRLVVVDYMQLMSSPRKVENRQQEVSEISRSMKLLAKELEVPVVALSQLNRLSEQRADKRPMLSDLRESGSLEQDADIVVLLHRDDMYEKESARAGEADLIVAKHRNGPTDVVTVAFQGHYSRFVDMTAAPPPATGF